MGIAGELLAEFLRNMIEEVVHDYFVRKNRCCRAGRLCRLRRLRRRRYKRRKQAMDVKQYFSS